MFLTLSCAELHWDDLKKYLQEKNKDLPKWVRASTALMLQKDPASLMKFYSWRVQNFIDTVIKPKDGNPGVFGLCTHYYFRVEFQARGAPHVHAKVRLL